VFEQFNDVIQLINFIWVTSKCRLALRGE